MGQIKVYKKRTVLVKWTGEKIVVDIPIEVIDQAMSSPTMKINSEHFIRTNAINEWYSLNVTDESEARIMDTFPNHVDVLMKEIEERKKKWLRVNKEIIGNIFSRIIGNNGSDTE